MPFTLTHTGPALTLNAERRLHWRDISAIKKQWREDIGWVAVAVKRKQKILSTPVGVEVRIWQPTANLADAAGHFPVAKAFLDGLVDAKVLPDDSPAYVAWMRLWTPEKDADVPKGCVRLQLTLVEI